MIGPVLPACPNEPHRVRAALKAALVAAVVLAALVFSLSVVDQETVYGLKQSLSLWLIMALVVIVNLVSFIVIALLFAAYKWIRRDLDPREDE
jgi:uncharacterized membrane protein